MTSTENGRTGLPTASPDEVGVAPDAVEAAVTYAQTHEMPAEEVAYDFGNVYPWEDDPPEFGDPIGPVPRRRGGQNGVVVKNGRVIAEWGDTTRVDQSFSIAKSALSTVIGIAYDRGKIESIDDPVGDTVADGGFDSAHNTSITWRHLLEGTSEWEGTLFGKPDRIDRNRTVGKPAEFQDDGRDRTLNQPGTYWEYNDTRINRLALAALRVWNKPLPLVFHHEVMAPIGATNTWDWYGYYNSAVTIDGQRMQSVSGGGHWGGGLWISSRDLARFGQLYLADGTWEDASLISPAWVAEAIQPCDLNPSYGRLWWLNTNQSMWASAPATSYAALGFGGNSVWIDPEHDLVVVLRWLEKGNASTSTRPIMDGVFERLLAGI